MDEAFSKERNIKVEYSPLIERPPSSSLSLACIIPVYQEFENGNVFRVIGAFTKQIDASDASSSRRVAPDQFELIFVVNNRHADFQNNTEVFEENRKTLQIGRYLKDEAGLPENLNEYRRKVLEDARKKGLRVEMIDLTAGVERNMGLIRDIGVREAIYRFNRHTLAKGNGIIAHLDADVSVASRYVKKILERFKAGNIDSLFVSTAFKVVEGSSTLFASTYGQQYMYEKWSLLYLLYGGDETMLNMTSARIVATVSAHEKVGGVDRARSANEDFDLSRKLIDQTRYDHAFDIKVYKADRARESGFDAAARQMADGQIFHITDVDPRESMLGSVLRTLVVDMPNVLQNDKLMSFLFDKIGINYDWYLLESISQEVQARRSTSPNLFPDNPDIEVMDRQEDVRSVISIYFCKKKGYANSLPVAETSRLLVQTLKKNASQEEQNEIDRIIRRSERDEQLRLGNNIAQAQVVLEKAFSVDEDEISLELIADFPKALEFLERNPWMLDKLKELRRLYPDANEAFLKLTDEYPDLLKPYEETPHRKGTAVLRGANQFLLKVEAHPEQYPVIDKFIKLLRNPVQEIQPPGLDMAL